MTPLLLVLAVLGSGDALDPKLSVPNGGDSDLSPCLSRMAVARSRAQSTEAPTFATELECELWTAIVLLEGDVRSATTALAACDEAIAELAARPPVVVPVIREPASHRVRDSPVVDAAALFASAGAGAGAGALAGYAIDSERPAPAVIGAVIGAVLGCVFEDLAF